MNLVLQLTDFSINNVFFHDQVKNTVMENGKFIRIIYSDAWCALTGIFVRFPLTVVHVEKSFNKFKCVLAGGHSITTEQIMRLEQELLCKCADLMPHKLPIFRISEQLSAGLLKVFNYVANPVHEEDNEFILKIYGIWENDTEYGLTYKINDM